MARKVTSPVPLSCSQTYSTYDFSVLISARCLDLHPYVIIKGEVVTQIFEEYTTLDIFVLHLEPGVVFQLIADKVHRFRIGGRIADVFCVDSRVFRVCKESR